MKNHRFLAFVLATLLLGGCGGKSGVEGHVRFEDGTPLTVGSVVFESGGYSASGRLDSAGKYVLSSAGKNDGIKPGEYKVYIVGAVDNNSKPMTEKDPILAAIPLIDGKFRSPEKSGLSCSVTGKTTFNITVTPPAK